MASENLHWSQAKGFLAENFQLFVEFERLSMVAINLSDSAKKEKPSEGTDLSPSDLQLYETCNQNGRTIFRTTIFIQVATLALFIRLVYCLWTFDYVRHLLELVFSILGLTIFGYSNTLAHCAYYKTNESHLIRVQRIVLIFLLGLNILIIILIWKDDFVELIEWRPAPLVMFGLPIFVPLQAHAIVVWQNIERKMIAGEDHQSIAFYDQAIKWKQQLYVELWTIEARAETNAPIPNQHTNQYHRFALVNEVLYFMFTFFADLATLCMFIIIISHFPGAFIRYHQGYMTALTLMIGLIFFIIVNTPALCAYFRTKKSRHVTFKYNSVMAIATLTTVIIYALCAHGGYSFNLPTSLGLVFLVPIQLYSAAIWWRIKEKMALGEDYRLVSIFDPICAAGSYICGPCWGRSAKEAVDLPDFTFKIDQIETGKF